MSRPIYEPSLPRADAELGYGNRQLFRRPAPRSEEAALPTFRAIIAGFAHSQTFFDTPPGYGMENPDTVRWDAWDNGDPSIFIEHLDPSGPYAGELANVEYTAEGLYLVKWRIDWENFFADWIVTGASYDNEIYTKYHGPYGSGDPSLWFYGADGFTELRYWNAADNFSDPSVEIILGQNSGADQTLIGDTSGAWAMGTELIIVYLGPSTAMDVLIIP